GSRLVSGYGGFQTDMRLYDARGRMLGVMRLGGRLHSVAFAPNSKMLAAAIGRLLRDKPDVKGKVLLIDPVTEKILTTLPLDAEAATAVAFAADGKTLAVASSAGKAHIWDVATGKERATLSTGPVTALAYARDGKTLAVGLEDHSIRLWGLEGEAVPKV